MKETGITHKLINSLGGRFSRELGIELSGVDSHQVFKWFLASKLFGARISTGIAIKTYREFDRRSVTSPEKILDTGWDGLVKILDDGGYVRYDFSTATKLLEITEDLIKYYDGDLNELHHKARDEQDLEKLLKKLGKGIGDVTVNIFLRELRKGWKKAQPELSDFVTVAAQHLGLIKQRKNALRSLNKFWSAHKVRGTDFCDFEAALLRLGKDYCKKSRHEVCPVNNECRDLRNRR